MASFFWLVAGMLVVTYLPRLIPMLVLSRTEIPRGFRCWLEFVPAAVLSALLAPSILLQNGSLALRPDNAYLLAAVPTLIVAVRFKNIFLTVLCGIACLLLIRLTLGIL
jgi:branched-subunit amino acid transport protein